MKSKVLFRACGLPLVEGFLLLLFFFAFFMALGAQRVVWAADREKDPEELTFIFQKQANPEVIKRGADEVALYLSRELRVPVKVKVPSDYSASVQALVSKKADFAYTSSLPFLLARRDGDASLILAEERPDASGTVRTDYDSVFVVRKESPLASMSDIIKQAGQLRMVFTSPTSASGYLFPYARLVREGLLVPKQDPKQVFKSVSFGGSYTQAVEQVLLGRADVGAVSFYAVEGPQAAQYLVADQLAKIKVIGRTPGVPTHIVSARAGLSPELRGRVKQALLKMSSERPDLLKDVYGAASLREVDEDKHLEKTVEAVQYLGLPVEKLM